MARQGLVVAIIAATLHHKARDHPVKQAVAITILFNIGQKVSHCLGRLLGIQFEHHSAHGGFHAHSWLGGCRRGGFGGGVGQQWQQGQSAEQKSFH